MIDQKIRYLNIKAQITHAIWSKVEQKKRCLKVHSSKKGLCRHPEASPKEMPQTVDKVVFGP